jgi:signal transduction histidine kinase
MAAPIMALSLVPLAVGLSTAWYGHRSLKRATEALDRNVHGMRAAEELAIGIRDVRTQLQHFVDTGERSYLDGASAIRREQDLDHWLAEAKRTAVTEREQDRIAQIEKGYRRFFADLEHIAVDEPESGAMRKAGELIQEVTRAVLIPAQQYLDDDIEREIASSNEENLRTADQMVLTLILLGTCGPIAGLLAGYGVARGISRSIVRLSVPIRDAAGKLSAVVGPMTFSGGMSLEELEGMLKRMADQVGAVVERLEKSQREALRAEQLAAVGQMAAGMAHELRNPLMSMKILVQSATERSGTGTLGGRDLVVLEEEMTHLERSIQTFLDFARPPSLDKRAFSVQDLIRQTIELVSGRAEQQGVRLECRLPEAPIVIQADVGQFRQVLLNLLLNACDALAQGGKAWVEAEVGPDAWLTVRVVDTGCGLPAKLGQEIFQPFVSTKETGMGLGLSICKRIVESHGGEISAANRPEGGAVFTVKLPMPAAPTNEPRMKHG